MTLLWLYLGGINAAAFLAMGMDKSRARRRQRRIPEATLLLLSVVGGSVGGILGMLLFRHKTRHPLFFVGFPVILLIQCLIALAIYIFLL